MNGITGWRMQANEPQCLSALLTPPEEGALVLTRAQALQLLETLITMDYPVLNRGVAVRGSCGAGPYGRVGAGAGVPAFVPGVSGGAHPASL